MYLCLFVFEKIAEPEQQSLAGSAPIVRYRLMQLPYIIGRHKIPGATNGA